PTANLGFSLGHTFWDTTKIAAHITKISSKASVTLEGGLVGPNYGGRLEVAGDVSKDKMDLHVTLDEFQAGMVIGLTVDFEMSLEAKTKWKKLVVDGWDSHFETIWKTQFDITVPFKFDLFSLLITLGEKALALVPALKTLMAFIPKPGGFKGIWDEKQNIVGNDGKLVLHPQIIGKIDIINLLETLGKDGVEAVQPELVPAVEAANKVNQLMRAIRPTPETGPVFGIDFPMELKMTTLTAVDDAGTTEIQYTDLDFVGDEVRAGGPEGPFPDNVAKIGAQFTHRSGVDIVVGWYSSLSWLKVLSIGKTAKWSVFEELGIDVFSHATAFTNEMRNDAGSMSDATVEVNFIGQKDT
ncbi:MAG: hypothetical protein ACQERN_07395, partial [Thermodesulfobacteriota bacterium]